MHTVSLQIAPDHPAFAGHFPGQPLLPGVALISYALEAALALPALALRLGTAPHLSNAKFLAPVRPGERIDVHLLDTPAAAHKLAFEIRCGDRVAASGQFEGPAQAEAIAEAAKAQPA